MTRLSVADEIAAVRKLCGDLGLGDVTPRLLKAGRHTMLQVSPLAIVARVQSLENRRSALETSKREIAVTQCLANRGAPVLAPLPEGLAGPFEIGGAVITLWPLVSDARTAEEDEDRHAVLAARTLAEVHRAFEDFDGPLPPFTDVLDSCRETITSGACNSLPIADRDLLLAHYDRLRRSVDAADAPWRPLHGDPHCGNLLLGNGGARWIDFETACSGPREIDISCLPRASWAQFPDADPALLQRYADLKSVCIAAWCWADRDRSAEVREAAEHHLNQVRGFSATC